MDFSLTVVIAGILIGLSKGGIGGAATGPLVLVLISQTIPAKQTVGVMLPLLMFADLFAVRFYWREWDMTLIRLLLPMALLGILLGTLLLDALSDEALRRLLGVITLGVLAYKLLSDALQQVEYEPRNWHGYLAGWSAGFSSALANLGGPPISIYLLLQKVNPVSFVGTTTLFFFVVNILKVPGYLQTGAIEVDLLPRVALALPFIPFGVWVGRRIIGWINQVWFERMIIVLLLYAGLQLLLG